MVRAIPALLVVVLAGPGCNCGAPPGEGEGEGAREGEGAAAGEGEGEGAVGEGEGEGVVDPAVLCQDGFCWENPRPHGFALQGVWPLGSGDIWVGAQGGGGFAHFQGGAFTVEQAEANGFPVSIAKIWGADASSLFAAAGVILRKGGGAWAVDNASFGLGQYLDVWGFGRDDVWAIGNNAAHFDGTAWTSFALNSTETFTSLHGLATDDMWAVGNGPLVAHFDGTSWTTAPITTAPNTFLDAIWENAPDDIWVGGDASQMWHFDGAWTAVPSVPNHRATAIVGIASDDVWAVGDGGIVQHWNGTSWGQAATFGVFSSLLGMRMRAPDDIWAVGAGGLIVHFDGTNWTRVAVPAHPVDGALAAVTAVEGVNGVEAWAVGSAIAGGGLIGRRGGDGVWQAETGDFTGSAFSAVLANAVDDVWALGSGPAFHYDGGAWTSTPMPSQLLNVTSACANAPNDLWAVGSDRLNDTDVVLRGDGATWSIDATFDQPTSGSDPSSVSHVFCAGGDDVWAGGIFKLLHRDATSGAWARLGTSSLTSSQQFGRAASGPDDVWLVQGSLSTFEPPPSTVVHYDGVDWTTVDLGFGARRPLDVADAAGDVWLAGTGGLVAHLAQGTFNAVDVGSTDDFAFVRPLANGHVMLVATTMSTYEWDGLTLTARFTSNGSASSFSMTSVYFAGADDAWATVGSFGALDQWDGATWTEDFNALSPASFEPSTIWGFARDDIWVGGDESASIAHYDGQGWTTVTLGDEFPDEVRGIWGAAPDDVWAVTNPFATEAKLFHNTGSGFVAAVDGQGNSNVGDNSESRLFGIYGTSATDFWAWGNQGVFDQTPLVVRGDGTTFARYITLESPQAMQRVNGRLLAVDVLGGVFERTAAGWTAIVAPGPTPDPFNEPVVTSGFFVSDTDAWVLGNNGGLQHFDGTSLSQAFTPGFGIPAAVVGGDAAGDVFTVGFSANVLHKAP